MYFKNIENGYIVSISEHRGEIQIAEEEYNELQKIIDERPMAASGFEYKLKEDLTWELCKITEEYKEISESEGEVCQEY